MIKRTFDIAMAAILLLLLSPIMLVVALLIRFDMGGEVFFRQWRPGKDEIPFQVIKFKTMRDAVDDQGRPLPDEERVTRLGLCIRRASLDELPQLFNILKGDMSFVGPRPLLMEYLPYIINDERRRHEVRPGVTGLAQVNGRQDVSWEKKLRLDVEYVEQQTFWLDLRILCATLVVVFKREGILYAAPQGRLDDYRKRLGLRHVA
ncbi:MULTISPECIES: sugar transferase [unclassified Halomonas]|uniref:sugar transferase n=1 Tax=unclassified Halomonas TaxID=2609666 RepID=UPI002884AB06|nr:MULTISPECIES: sugar transferase [unclassified Halomonas]MDT0499434.1 sugar transferase [Halomonas sp. PAR7]MDT0510749.1 sugar transferase [Halomonas sp. LES1]MDT0591722.1 sugar transferase [Halomonas sp. PAR8]